MVWLLSALLYVHVLGAIFWFGSSIMFHTILVPALVKLPYEAQHNWLESIRDSYSRVVGPIAGLTILFGILRGAFAGVFSALTTPYGITFVAAFLLAIPVVIIGTRFVGVTAAKLAAAGSRDEVLSLAGKMRQYGRFELGGMGIMLALMIAMHAGY